MPEKINPKVHSASISGGAGGGAVAVILVWIMQAMGVPEAQFTPERIVALTSLCGVGASYIGGYFKSAE